MDPARFAFLDETGAGAEMVRGHGRAPRGERLVDAAPHGHWRATAFVAGLRGAGRRGAGLAAPLALDGPTTGAAFRACVEQALAPELSPGGAVALDNPAAHKAAGVREAVAAAGAGAPRLPPRPPDLNPIEQVFAELKALPRRAAARTEQALRAAIGGPLDPFSPAGCRDCLANRGYESERVGNALAACRIHAAR